jgi:hypothetical protein
MALQPEVNPPEPTLEEFLNGYWRRYRESGSIAANRWSLAVQERCPGLRAQMLTDMGEIRPVGRA